MTAGGATEAPDLPPALAETLIRVAAILAQATQPWWIISGAAVALHGVDAWPVGDVDLLIGDDDAAWLLSSLALPMTAGTPSDRFRSAAFGTWRAPPLAVDIMARFEVRGATGWAAVVPVTREAIQVGAATVHVPARAELATMLRRFGRAKDLARAAALEAARG